MTKLCVPLTEDFRLTANDREFIVEERFIVDPTRAPGYKGDGNEEVRETWRPVKYYGLRPSSLRHVIEYVTGRTAANSGATSLTELAAAIRETSARLTGAINAAFSPEIGGELGALGPSEGNSSSDE